ncbi:MAG TPA: phosphoribosyltransferase family protein [Verrucomicrobiae bacterium]|nr:phosphoribosyltransferase family protein [Verrucomicrobiae bacterium]
MVFASRAEAGQHLGQRLKELGIQPDWVLGLPRGGVVVAAAVARELKAALDVLIVRKIGHPLHREFAVGAMAEGGVVVLDSAAAGSNPSVQRDLHQIIAEETQRLEAYRSLFHRTDLAGLAGKHVLLVDDGLATGATTEAAVLAARKQGALRIIVAAPVASTHAVARLRRIADEVVALWVDPNFDAVGRYYQVFDQTTDEEVLGLLKAA